MNAPVNPQKPMVSIATDSNKRMGFNNFVKDIQGVMPMQPMMAPQMPPPMPQQAMVPQIPAMPASSQSIRGGIGMPMAPVQGFQDGGAAGLTNVEKILIRDHGFSLNPEGQVVSPAGQIRSVVDGKTTFSTPPTFDQQFAAQQASAIDATNQDRMNQAIASGSNTYQSMATDGSGVITDTSIPSANPTYIDNNIGDNFGQIVSPVTPPEEEPVSTLTPIQQAAQAIQQKIEDVGFDTYKKRDDEYNVRFADNTSKFDQDILDQFGVSKSDFLDALRGYGNYVGSVGNRQSAGAGFEQGLENILNPEEAQERYDAQLSAREADEKRDARTAAQIQRAQDASKLKTGQGFLADLQAAGTDLASRPGRLMDDLSDLGSSVSQGFSDLTSGISDLFTGGRPSGVISAEAPIARPDIFTTEPFSDPMYGEQGRGFFPPDTEITQSDLPPAVVPLGPEDFAPYPLGGGADNNPNQNFGTAPNVATNLGISLGGDTADRSGVLPSSDLGRLLSGDPQVVDNVIKLLAIDPDKTKSDLISTATTTFGDSPSRITGSGDAPVIGGVPQLGTLQNLDFTNLLQDRDMAGLGDDTGSIDLSGLPRPPQSLSQSQRLNEIAGDEGPISNEQELQNFYDRYGISEGDLNRLGPENFAPYPEQSDSLLQQFRDAQPEGALKGGAFDFVPDAEQLGNFMRGIIGPAGAAEAPVDRADLQRQLDALKENQVYDAALADIPINPLVDSPIGSLPAAPRTGVGTISGEGVTGTARSTDDLLDDIRTGAVTTTYYNEPTTGIALPSNVTYNPKPMIGGGNYNLIDGSISKGGVGKAYDGRHFTITNPDGSRTFITSADNPQEFVKFLRGLQQIGIPAGSTIIDDPKTEGTYQRNPADEASLQFFDDTQAPISVSMITEDALQKQSDAQLPALREEAGGGGSQGSGLLGDLTGFEQRFESDAPTEIAELNNQSQLTDLTNLLNESGSSISDADADAIEGLNILSSEFSDSDQDASSGDVLANILNTGDDATGDAIGGGASSGDGISDADINVINDAIANMTGDDDTGDATGTGTGAGVGTGDGDGTGTGSGTGTGTGTGTGDGDDTGTGGGGGDVINIPPSGGDSGGSKQERRDYSRMREILEQRPRRIGGTAPGLGYKPVEGISNTLNKAADNFLDALRFG